MASIYGAYNKYTRLRIDYSIKSNTEDNTSTINMTMFAERTKASQQAYNPSYYSMTGKEQTAFSYNWGASSYELEIGSSSITVKHNDDGTATTTLEGYWNTRRTGSSYIPEELWVSQTITLPTIARRSQVGLHSTDITLGNPLTIYTNRASTAFTHALYWQGPDGKWNTIATNVTDSYPWNTSNAISNIASQFPNSSRGNITIICETYNNGTYIGSTTAILNFTISSQPTVSNISISGGINGVFVEDVSSVTTNVSASGIYGSSIKSYRIEMYNGSTKIKESYGSAPSASFTLSGLNLSADANITLKATIIDTRGNSGTASTTINVKDYYKPQITNRSAYRVNSSNAPDTNGTRLLIYWAYSTKSISGVTKDTAIVQYRKKGDSTWTPVTVANDRVAYVDSISTDYQYEVQFSISDGISPATVVTNTVPTGSVTMDFKAGGKGIAFGKVSEKDGFECNMPSYFHNDIIDRNDKLLRADIYSVKANDSSFDDVKANIIGSKAYQDLRPYIITNAPISDNNYIQQGLSHTVVGMEYGNQQYGSQLSMACNGRMLFRTKYAGIWGEWSHISQIFTRATNADWNNLTENGVYLDGSAPTGANYPVAWTGILEVFNKGGIVTQRYTYFQGNITFTRAYTNWDATWTPWKKTAGTILLTAMPSSRLAITGTAWTNQIISLNSAKSDVSSGLLTLSGGGVKIGRSINLVKVSASLAYFEYASTGETDLHILKNSEVVASIFHATLQSDVINNMTTNPIVINVKEGDIIYIAVSKNSDASMTILNNNGATSLTVEVV